MPARSMSAGEALTNETVKLRTSLSGTPKAHMLSSSFTRPVRGEIAGARQCCFPVGTPE